MVWSYNGKTPLSQPKRSGKTDNIVYLDTETTSETDDEGNEHLTLRLGYALHKRRNNTGAWTKGKWLRFEDQDTIADWLVSKTRQNKPVSVWAHNMDFDALICGFAVTLPKRGFTCGSPVFGSGPYICEYKSGDRSIRLLCSLNHLKFSLKFLGERFGKAKMEMPAPDASLDDWNAYGKNDVEVLAHVMEVYIDWLADRGWGSLKDTAPQQADYAFRKNFMNHPLKPSPNETHRRVAEGALYGGRTECFWIGKSYRKVYYVDINSAYPYVMRDGWYPTELVTTKAGPDFDWLRGMLRKHILIGEVDVKAGSPDYPVKTDRGLVFPACEYRTYLAGAEFKDAFQMGRLAEVHEVAVYRRARVFRDWVESLYPERRKAKDEGDTVTDLLIKLYLNSLFGKFGQRDYKTHVIGKCPPERLLSRRSIMLKSGRPYMLRCYAGMVTASWTEGTKSRSMPEIAACVTAEGRMMITKLIRRVGRKNILYCDTDSAILTEAGYEALGRPGESSELGAWSLEGEPGQAVIRGLKDYRFGDKDKIKGVRNPDDIIDDKTYKDAQWSRTLGAISRGDVRSVLIRHGVKELKRDYRKGRAPLFAGYVRPLRSLEPGRRG